MLRWIAWLLYAVLLVAFPAVVRAQDATLTGVVTDATDAVLPGVTVTATHTDTGTTFVAVTEGTGTYRIPALRVGTYRVTAELTGFTTASRDGVQLLVGQNVVLNFKVAVSTLQETVTVSGQAPLVDTTASELGGNITPTQMQALPVNGRNWMGLTVLAPGSRANDVGESPTGIGGTTGGGSARGDPGYYQLILDGQQVTNTMAQSTFGQPKFARDAIGEFQFMSARFDATQGRSQGVLVNAVTKSGANTPFGSQYGYFRDDSFNAADFVAKRVLPYSNQQVGGTFGGPIIRDRAHIFGYYELEREPTTFTFGGAYPRFNIDPLTSVRKEHKGGFRADLQINTRNRLLMRGNLWNNDMPIDIGSFTGGSLTGHPSTLGSRQYQNYQGYVSLTQMLGQRSVHEVKVGWFVAFSDQYGLDGLEESPVVLLRGYTLGKSQALPLRLNGHMWSLRDDFSTIWSGKGTHEVHFGGDLLFNHDFYEWQNARHGVFDARGGPVPGNVEDLFPVWNDPSTWNTAALSPIAVRYFQSFGKWAWTNETPKIGAWFQDNWHVNSELTLNLGLRWDYAHNWAANQWSVPPLRSSVPNEFTNFGPRLGFAYSPGDKKTVYRGGWGVYFIGPKDQWSHHTPANLSYVLYSANYDGRADFFANPYGGSGLNFRPVPAGATVLSDQNFLTCPSHPTIRCDVAGYIASDQNKVPYSHQTSFGFQRQLGETMSFQADYQWNAGRREQYNQNTNLKFDPATGAPLPFSVLANRPWPDLGITLQTFAAGKSNYHALESAFTKRLSHRWQASATYTLSKFDDYIPKPYSGNEQVTFAVPVDVGDSWFPALGDQRHRAVFNSIVDLPYGIQASGLYFYGSGQAMGASYGADLRNSGNLSFSLRPDGSIVPRNTPGRFKDGGTYGDPIHRVDLRLLRRFKIYGRATVEGSFEMFNVFNHANYGSYVGAEVSPLYGQPQQNFNVAYLPRMLQLGFRFAF
ncbi:MAG: carboxypeptidase regulatory-like domain-containing protein [Vicinamibacterales bacterium]